MKSGGAKIGPRMGAGGWIALLAMGVFLALAIIFLVIGWGPGSEDGGTISFAGWVALVFGTLFTLALGIGLMALMFYSQRSGRD